MINIRISGGNLNLVYTEYVKLHCPDILYFTPCSCFFLGYCFSGERCSPWFSFGVGGVAALGIQAKFVENSSFSRCNNINNSITRVVSRNNLIHDIIKIYAF